MTHSEKKISRKAFVFFLKISHEEKCEQSENGKDQKNVSSIHKICLCIFGNRRPNKSYIWKVHLVLSIYRYLTWCVKV